MSRKKNSWKSSISLHFSSLLKGWNWFFFLKKGVKQCVCGPTPSVEFPLTAWVDEANCHLTLVYLQDGVRHGGEEPLSLQDENVPQAKGQRERRLREHNRSSLRLIWICLCQQFHISAVLLAGVRRFVWFFPRPQRPIGPSELSDSAGQRSADSGRILPDHHHRIVGMHGGD